LDIINKNSLNSIVPFPVDNKKIRTGGEEAIKRSMNRNDGETMKKKK
jgi:hypothetical protein